MDAVLWAAGDGLAPLSPDSSWDVSGLRWLAGGVLALCLLAAVALVVMGVLTMLPGRLSGNAMEGAFSWRRLLAALLVPLTVGTCSVGWAWGATTYGGIGLQPSSQYASRQSRGSMSDMKDVADKGSDSLGGLVAQLGKELAKGVADTVSKAAKEAVTTALSWLRKPGEWWAWWAGSDGTGKNGFQKLPDKFGEWGSWLIKHLPKLPVMPVL